MEALILLTLLGIIWLVSSRRWRRTFVTPLIVVLLILLGITSPPGIALATQGLTFSLPQDSGEVVDAIVLLGRGETLRQNRVERIEEIWQEKRATQLFISGMSDAQIIAEQLIKNGIAKQFIDGESCSQFTKENALFTAAILRPQGIQKILLVTDAPHMLRSLLVFRSFGFTVIPQTSPLSRQLSTPAKVRLILREYLGLVGYALAGEFRSRPATEIETPPVAVTQKIADWNCRIQKS